jgi:hypothetical protein
MILKNQINQVDLAAVAKSCGVELKSNGNRYSGRCPFHEDRSPSFFVFPDNRFKCFGCGVAGDPADFIQLIYNCSFKEALAHLGIKPGGGFSHSTRKEIQERDHRQDLIALFREWERFAVHTYSLWVRATRTAIQGMTIEEFNRYGQILDPLPYWEHCLDILCSGDDREKFLLFKEHKEKGIKLLRRNYLFRPDFNYKEWLRKKELSNG